MAESIRDKLLGARVLVGLGRLSLPGVDLDEARAMAGSALTAVRDGRLGYAIVCARKPALDREGDGSTHASFGPQGSIFTLGAGTLSVISRTGGRSESARKTNWLILDA